MTIQQSALRTIVACAAALTMLFALTGTAQGAQQNFCYGANLAPSGGGCQSGSWKMNAAYANSMDGPICLFLPSVYAACSKAANEGIYIGGVCATQRASIINYNPYWIKGYGTFWTC